MTVFEYLDFFGAAYGLSQGQRDTIIGDVLALTDMAGRKNDFIQGLSRGMQQRVSLARVLAQDTGLVFLDEPTASLDPVATSGIEDLITGLSGDYTIVLVTHDIDEALFLGDRIVFLSRHPGRVKEILKPEFKQGQRLTTKEALYDSPGFHEISKHVIHLMREEGAAH